MFFIVEISGSRVAVGIDDENISNILIEQFIGAGADVEVLNALPTNISTVTSREIFKGNDRINNLWNPSVIYAKRSAEEAEECSVLVTDSPKSVTIIKDQTIEVLRFAETCDFHHLHHMIRYPLRAELEKKQCILVHAAGVVVEDGCGVLLVGPKGAGKTTLLMELLNSGMWMLGNDAIMVNAANGEGVNAYAWPHVIRLGQGTINNNKILLEHLNNYSHATDGKVEIYHDVMNKIYKRNVSKASCVIKAIFDVRFDLNASEMRINKLTGDEADLTIKERIREDRFQTGWLPGWKWEANNSIIDTLVEELKKTVKVYSIIVSPQIEHWGEGINEFTETIRNLSKKGSRNYDDE